MVKLFAQRDKRPDRGGLSRRDFLASAALLAIPLVIAGWRKTAPKLSSGPVRLRPPMALVEEDFLAACIRCGRCGSVCPNQCIRYQSLDDGLLTWQTPYINARERACIVCTECTQVCPTGALVAITPDEAADNVHMGTAVVNTALCYSYNGRTCGACYPACPYPGTAMRVQQHEQPVVLDGCVGCGLCEQACIHLPQAIRVFPT